MAEANGTAIGKPASPAPDQSSTQPGAPGSPHPTQQYNSQVSQPIPAASDDPNAVPADPSTATRPHDARTIHMFLATLGVNAYQERVPLQLLDFAYRYTASMLSDAQHLAAEGYVSSGGGSGSGSKGGAGAGAGEQISLAALRLATSSRLGNQFNTGLPKQTLLDLAKDRNKIQLPDPGDKSPFGLALPHERFVQTGTNWSMLEEWDSEASGDGEEEGGTVGENGAAANLSGDIGDDSVNDEEMEDGFDAVFGDDEDKEMGDG